MKGCLCSAAKEQKQVKLSLRRTSDKMFFSFHYPANLRHPLIPPGCDGCEGERRIEYLPFPPTTGSNNPAHLLDIKQPVSAPSPQGFPFNRFQGRRGTHSCREGRGRD